MADFDFSELDALSAELSDMPREVGHYLPRALGVTSLNVKKAAQKRVRGGDKSWRAAARAIDYEIKEFQGFGASALQAEIGYDKEKPGGPLGNLREFGAPDSPSGPLGPHNDLAAAMADNTEDFVRGVEQAVEDAHQSVLDNSTFIRRVGTFLRGGRLGNR